jgi:2,4-dienoyl-CoA reductase-like NADH-dependent reductase (Old Yellow Enzyme family)
LAIANESHERSGSPREADRLFSSLKVGELALANRIVLTAMVTRLSGEDGFVNSKIKERYLRLARGEPGLMVVEATAVHGSKSGPLLRMSDDAFIEGHRAMLDAIRELSPTKVALQLIHFLKISRSGWRQLITDLSKDEIRAIPEMHASAAERARRAGYDAVELHMAHAYTLSSFLSRVNKRTDQYGGTLENRLRLPSEVVAAVRRAVPSSFCIGVRFDGEECIKNGYSAEEAKLMALRFARLGADYISLSAGGKFEDAVKKEGEPLYPYTGYSGDRTMPASQYPDMTNLYIAETVKSFLLANGHATPVVATGKIRTRQQMETMISSGQADLVGIARGLLADPDLPRKLRSGREDTVVRCVYANVCKNLDENFQEVRCFLWPKGELNAPSVDDIEPPVWDGGGSWLRAEEETGKVRLEWGQARDPQGVYGYEIFRSAGDEAFESFAKQPAYFHRRWFDKTVISGVTYRYFVRAYDLAGNRSEPTPTIEVRPRGDAGA